MRKPKLVTFCPDCKREDVGVARDWAHRDGNDRVMESYRISRHKTKYGDHSAPICVNSRSPVSKENIFERAAA